MLNKLAILIMIAISGNALATDSYDPNKSYSAGTQILFNGNVYEAQWWANPQQSPATMTANSWESPWILISEGDGITPPVQPEPPEPSEPTTPTPPPEIEGDVPNYLDGGRYKGGDIVQKDGQLYRCKVGVTQAWCSGAAWAYAPGTGSAWASAWEPISENELNKPEIDKPNPIPPVVTPPVIPEPPTPEPDVPNSGDGFTITQQELDEKEAKLTDFPVMNQVKETIRTLDNEAVEKIMPLSETNPENVKRIEGIITTEDWEFLFPKRAPEYTYRHFLQATGKFPAFCATYDDGRNSDEICRKALATMFAHFTQETGGHTAYWDVPEWRQGLVHVREMGWDENMRGGYNGECNPKIWQGQTWPCGEFENGDFKSYFGRGAKQLSYNYNYGPFSEAMFGSVRPLLDEPDLVADTWLNLASAVFFFTYPQPPKPSMLHVLDGTWQPNDRDKSNGLLPGFGVTTQIINGGVECGGTVEVAQSVNRIDYYKNHANYLGVDVPSDEVLGCKGMKFFDEDGSGAVSIYWEKDWGWSTDTPDGQMYSCQLVGYQTPYSAFKQSDFSACVKANFPDVNIVEG